MINQVEYQNHYTHNDMVEHPNHYTQGGIECWDAMRSCMSEDEFRGYLRGCAIKYLWRCNDKGSYEQDLQKARAYIDELLRETA